MKIRSLMCLALLRTVSPAVDPFYFEPKGLSSSSQPFDFKSIEKKGLTEQQRELWGFVSQFVPQTPRNYIVRNLQCMALKINTLILSQHLESLTLRHQQVLLQPRVDPQVQLLTEKKERKKAKLTTLRLQLATQQEEVRQLQSRTGRLESQVEALTRNQHQDQSAILTLQQQLGAAHKNFNDKNLELTQLQDTHTYQILELHQQIKVLTEEKECNQENLVNISHQLQTANNQFNAKEKEFILIQTDYSQQAQSLQQQIAALIKHRESDHQALEELEQKLHMATLAIQVKEGELKQAQYHYDQLMQRVKELTASQRHDQQALEKIQTQLDAATNQLRMNEEEFGRAKEKHAEESEKLQAQISNLIETDQQNQQILVVIRKNLEFTAHALATKQCEWNTTQQEHAEQINNFQKQLRDLQTAIKIKQQKIEKQENQLKAAENKILEADEQLAEIKKKHIHQVHGLQEKIKELTEAMVAKQKMLEEQQIQLNEAKEELQEKELQFITARNVQENKIYSLEEKVETLMELTEVQQQESSKQLTQAKNKILEARFQLEETHHHLENIKEEYRKLTEASGLQQQDLKEHKLRLEQAQGKIHETEQELVKTQETYILQMQELEGQVKDLIGLNESKQHKIEEQEVQLKHAESKIFETEQELVKTQETYSRQAQMLESQIKDLTGLNDSKQAKIEAQKVQLEQAQGKIHETEQELAKTQETYSRQAQVLEGQVKDLHGLNVAQQQQLNLQKVQLEQLTNQNYELEKAYTNEKQTSNKWKQMFLEAQKKLREQEEKFHSFVHFIKDATVKVEAGKENVDPNLSPLSSPRRSSPCSPNRALSPRPVNNTPNGAVRSLFLTINGQ